METSNKEFFDKTSVFYDSMINFERSIERKLDLFKRLNISDKQIADLGCGSGIDSIALAQLHNRVEAFDPSAKMIELAINNSNSRKLEILFNKYAIEEIPEEFNNKYSFICSLGNTIANIEPKNLLKAIQRIKELLISGGKVLIQILNYNLILSKKERIISINESMDQQFVRFYDFNENNLVFNILKFSLRNPKEYDLLSTILYPHNFVTINQLVSDVGFAHVEYYGNFNFDEYEIKKSKDLIILLTK